MQIYVTSTICILRYTSFKTFFIAVTYPALYIGNPFSFTRPCSSVVHPCSLKNLSDIASFNASRSTQV